MPCEVFPVTAVVKRVEQVMHAEPGAHCGAIGALLFGLSGVYGPIVRLRNALYQRGALRARRLACPVLCVGNITLGGTGKTPMTIHMAKLLVGMGLKPAIISRGYGGRAQKTGGIVSDGDKLLLGTNDAGDEPVMMAYNLPGVPVVVGRDRYRSGALALERFQADILLMDDGFQHRALARDFDLVLLDAKRPFGNGSLFPRGVLREPQAALKRAHALVLTRADAGHGKGTDGSQNLPVGKGIPIFTARHRPYILWRVPAGTGSAAFLGEGPLTNQGRRPSPEAISADGRLGRCGYAFSGIAGNRAFREGAMDLGLRLSGYDEYPDHHGYSVRDLEEILDRARISRAQFLLTTQKDFVRLPKGYTWPLDLIVIGVRVEFMDPGFDAMIGAYVQQLLATTSRGSYSQKG